MTYLIKVGLIEYLIVESFMRYLMKCRLLRKFVPINYFRSITILTSSAEKEEIPTLYLIYVGLIKYLIVENCMRYLI